MSVANRVEPCPVLSSDYDRGQTQTGIVHLGYGAFHRAHQAVYIDDYMQHTDDWRWGIAAVNLRASESASFARSAEMSDGYILKTTTPEGDRSFQRIRSHCAHVDWTIDPEQAEELLALPQVHAVTITVTESGYCLNNDFSLNTTDPVIASELAGGEKRSIYGFLAVALKRRWQAHGQPINLLCCDNIRENGRMLRRELRGYMQRLGENDLLAWVDARVSFPCSMVDRITPRATDALQREVAAINHGVSRESIHAEAFIQWVLEDSFTAPMPDLAQVGVKVVKDVEPYEEAKIRILNGGHTGLCYLGALKGHQTYDATILDPELREIFDRYQQREVLPGLDFPLPFDKGSYLKEVTARFASKAIADQLERICMDGYSKIPIYIRPTLESCLKQGIQPSTGFLCVASWYVYARRFRDQQVAVAYHEPCWSTLAPLLVKGCENDFAWAERLWGDLPARYPAFVSGIAAAIREVEQRWPV